MYPAFLCHNPSGASFKQLLHFSQEIKYGFFGKYMHGSQIPTNFELWRITTPLILHFSLLEPVATPVGVNRLITELNNSQKCVQTIDTKFNHIDFLWSINAASLVYAKIISFFQKYQ